MTLRTVGVRLTAEVSDYRRKMADAAKSTRDLTGEMERAARAGHLDAVADQAAVAGVALLGVAGAAVKLSMDFEKSMSAVGAATRAGAKEMEQLREAALQAGQDTQYSATQAANAVTELAKAGVATADILNGGLDGALDLAAAGQLDVAEAAETAASAMVQFKLKGRDLPHVADLLAAAAGKAQGSVHDMGMALNQAGLVAAQTGLSIEETTGGLAAFASAGLTGSDAGTSFKQMLLMLQAPSGSTKKLMGELGVSAYNAQGQFIGLSALAQQLRDRMAKLTPELRANAMATIFGADAVRGASILYEQGGKGIDEWIGKVNDAGYASETAAKLTDNLAGDLERLKGSLETFAIESGSGANSGLRVIAKSAEALVDEFAQLPPVVTGTATVMAGLGGALLLLGAGWVKARRSNAEMLEELRSTGPAGSRAATGLQAVTKWAGRAAAAFVAFEVAQAAIGAFQTDLNPQIEALSTGLADYAKSGKLAGESSRVLGNDLEQLQGVFQLLADDSSTKAWWAVKLQSGLEGLIPGLDGAEGSLARTKERVASLDSALTQLVQGGQVGEAKAAFDRMAATLAVNGVSIEEFTAMFPQYRAAVEVAGKQTDKTADSIDGVGASAEDAAKKTEELAKEFEALFGVQMSVDRAALKLRESTADLTEELTSGARTLSLNSEEGRKNRRAVLDQLDAIEDLRQARIAEGATLDEASRKYAKDIDGLKKSMRQAGFTKKEIDNLVGSYEKIPDKVTTKVSATGVTSVTVTLDDLLVKQRALQQGITPTQALGQVKRDLARTEKGVYAGGGWTGPGGTWDEAGIVHADEYVVKKSSRRSIEQAHPGLLDAMNATGRVPGYARGGRVWPFPVNASKADIPSWSEISAAVIPDAPGGTSGPWLERLLEQRFGVGMISGYRPGSRTLSGSRSYHSMNRAVDFPPIRAMAKFMYDNYKASLKEAITPWQEFNVHNGLSHRYTGAVWNQHNFAGGNAHNHFAMANGGIISEPVFGVGASGSTYSFGENWQPERVIPMHGGGAGGGATVHLTVVNHGVIGSRAETEAWLTGTLDDLKRRGKI